MENREDVPDCIEEMLTSCPILRDPAVSDKNPGIEEVAWWLYTVEKMFGCPPPIFQRLDVASLNEYIRLVNSRTDFNALRSYTLIKEAVADMRCAIEARNNRPRSNADKPY